MIKENRISIVLKELGFDHVRKVNLNCSVRQLIKNTLEKGQGRLTSTGAVACDTGVFTGRSPKDKFIVEDRITKDSVWWGEINSKFSVSAFDKLLEKVKGYLQEKEIYIKECYACAHPEYRLNIRVVTEMPWQSLFVHNLFLRPSELELSRFNAEWTILCAPGFKASPGVDSTRAENFTIINFEKKIILIGGSAYTGEIKKGIFTVLNYILPHQKKVLSMHCSANIGAKGDTAVFFGLSGTGKTTLSADPERSLIGDDEHGWNEDSVFNFEGGCYAKCVNLTNEKEPQIFGAIKSGTLLENVRFRSESDIVDYTNITVTENTRAAYPLNFIENSVEPSIGKSPENIFFLTADAFGVLPPISKLTIGQAMYHFISGYTAKVAGTEAGITEPQTTFSACFGKPFLPLHPTKYAELLGEKLRQNKINVWLVNTGWTGGSYGSGERISLKYTRAIISSALRGELKSVGYTEHPVFGLQMPVSCTSVPPEILNPRNTWQNKEEYDRTAKKLAQAFMKNFALYKNFANDEIIQGGPLNNVNV
jgi:phosphoenolpyruvate carboxykinase (ATP)